MFKVFRNKFGIPGVISVVALVFAMIGGAYAASSDGGGKATASAKKAKRGKPGKRGPTGATGATGPAGAPGLPGAQGSAGPTGAKGEPGSQGLPGKDGTDGEDGTDGTSVTVSEIPTEEPGCEGRGGALVAEDIQIPTEVEVCNGEEGSPWTDGGTLPPGATETGTWAFNGGLQTIETEVEGVKKTVTIEGTKKIRVPISFPIPLPLEFMTNAHVHYGIANSGGVFSPGEACPSVPKFEEFGPGETEEVGAGAWVPKAAPGELCVYQGNFLASTGLTGATFKEIYRFVPNVKGATSAGAGLLFEATAPLAFGSGSFAVTGCVPNAQLNGCATP